MAPNARTARRHHGNDAAPSPIRAEAASAAAVAMVGILAATLALPASVALAQTASAEGRWRSQQPALTLDIQRCSEGFCGMVVDASGRCGQRVLTFAPPASPDAPLGMAPTGRIQLPEHRAPLDARVTFARHAPAAAPRLDIAAVEAGSGAFMRRIFPFEAHLVRIGDAACATRPVS